MDGDGWVSATARCSCGMSSYDYGTGTFIDYCPGCGHYNCLYFEQCDPANGVIPGFTSVEGMWACSWCDMDFCCQCGKSHDSRGYWLTQTHAPEPPEKKVEPKIKTTHKIIEYHGLMGNGKLKIPIEVANHLKL